MVYETRRAVDVPIIGMGGICTADDAVEFLLAGADAVGVGTAIFSNPGCLENIVAGIDRYLAERGIPSVRDIVGTVVAD
jgi:dihydroorotate dehydrogenase (NAD+) catalytic subunit